MADKYYLLSKDVGDGPYLIGELSKHANNQYGFKYLIKGEKFPKWFMQLPRMASIKKTYSSNETLYYLIFRIVPEEESWQASILMKQFDLDAYDPWTILESLIEQHEQINPDEAPLCDSHQFFYIYKEIPENANRFDK